MVRRRTVLASFFASALSLRKSTADERPSASRRIIIAKDNIAFCLQPNTKLLEGSFEAPAPGWIAVGLNTKSELAGTRFLIAAIDPGGNPVYAEHIAQPPQHPDIKDVGATTQFNFISLQEIDNRKRLRFSIERTIVASPFALDLTAGKQVYLMLAWSQDNDFQHHSAWRKHFTITI